MGRVRDLIPSKNGTLIGAGALVGLSVLNGLLNKMVQPAPEAGGSENIPEPLPQEENQESSSESRLRELKRRLSEGGKVKGPSQTMSRWN